MCHPAAVSADHPDTHHHRSRSDGQRTDDPRHRRKGTLITPVGFGDVEGVPPGRHPRHRATEHHAPTSIWSRGRWKVGHNSPGYTLSREARTSADHRGIPSRSHRRTCDGVTSRTAAARAGAAVIWSSAEDGARHRFAASSTNGRASTRGAATRPPGGSRRAPVRRLPTGASIAVSFHSVPHDGHTSRQTAVVDVHTPLAATSSDTSHSGHVEWVPRSSAGCGS